MLDESLLLHVEGGGIFLRQPADWTLDMDLRDPIEEEEGKRLSICRKSALIGILAYKCGERVPVTLIKEQAPDFYEQLEDMADRALYKQEQKPFVSQIATRKDRTANAFQKKVPLSPHTSIDLQDYRPHQADPSIEILWSPLCASTGENSIAGVNDAIEKSLRAEKAIEDSLKKKAKKSEDETELVEYYEQLIARVEKQQKLMGYVPNVKMTNKIIAWLQNVFDYASAKAADPAAKIKRTQYCDAIFALTEEMSKQCQNGDYYKYLVENGDSYSKFSCITSPSQQRHWINHKKVKTFYSNGSTGFILKGNFKILIPDITSEEKKMLLKGPPFMNWPSKGIIRYEFLNIPDVGFSPVPPSVGVGDILRGGMKVKRDIFAVQESS